MVARLLEVHPRRHRRERALGRAHVLGEGARAECEQVAEDLVTRSEPGDRRPDRLDDPGDVQPDTMVPRCAQPHEEAGEGRPRAEGVEIGSVDGCGSDADEHLIGRGDGEVDISQLHDVGRAVSVPNSGLHVRARVGPAVAS